MSKTYIWRPTEYRTGPVEGLDLAFPVGIGSDMFYHTGDDEDGNAIFDQVGNIKFPDPNNKKVYEVTYFPQYEGPRENESEESKQERALYLDKKKTEEETKTVEETEEKPTEEPEAEAEQTESTEAGGNDSA